VRAKDEARKRGIKKSFVMMALRKTLRNGSRLKQFKSSEKRLEKSSLESKRGEETK